MSVYIKGMEMPKPKLEDMATVYCAYVLVSPNGHAAIVVDNEDGLDSTEYPLIPVPPHGDLIERDVLIRAYDDEHVGEPGKARNLMVVAPTIIAADPIKEGQT